MEAAENSQRSKTLAQEISIQLYECCADDKPVKSSLVFFSRLQNEVKDQVKAKKKNDEREIDVNFEFVGNRNLALIF